MRKQNWNKVAADYGDQSVKIAKMNQNMNWENDKDSYCISTLYCTIL